MAEQQAKAVHTMVRVLDLERAINFYKMAFGLAVVDRYDFDSFTLIYLRNTLSSFELELTVNKAQDQPYELGNGYGHLAVTVDSVDAEHERLQAAGLSPGAVKDFKHNGKTLARFFFISDPDGYKIEVIERGGRFV